MATQLTAYEECLRNPRARLQVATAKSQRPEAARTRGSRVQPDGSEVSTLQLYVYRGTPFRS